jgi:predicted transglutaminase-like cysteine proteinase
MTTAAPRRLRRYGLVVLGLAMLAWAGEETGYLPNARTLELVRQHYSVLAAERVQNWRLFIEAGLPGIEDEARLARVNHYFNRVPGVRDQDNWNQTDYWATPVELLAKNGGDCEDYALAKYFTLRALGMPAERLRITYVLAWIAREQRMESHMVLAYYATPDADPLILDNLIPEIKAASQRTDLRPTVSFNAEGLWSAKQRAQHGRIGDASRIAHWNNLLARMQQEK